MFERSATVGKIGTVTAFVAGTFIVAPAGAAMITYQQGQDNQFVTNYQGTEDTFVNARNPDQNNGANTALLSEENTSKDKRRPLIRFDVTSLQGESQAITSATLVLRQVETSRSSDDFQFSAYEVSDANGSWTGGDGVAATADAGESDWNHRAHPDTDWAGSNGLQEAGVDYVATALGSATYSYGDQSVRGDTNGDENRLSIPSALVEQWISGDNSGMLIFNDSTDPHLGQWHSAEYSLSADMRPSLEIQYTPIPEPATLWVLGMGSLVLLRRQRR